MNAELYRCEVAAAVVIGSLVTASWTLALSDPPVAASNGQTANHRLVVSNMTALFRAFGLGGQQGEMLAQQTADFGTLGAMETVATVGISVESADALVARQALRDACAAGHTGPLTAHTQGLETGAVPMQEPTPLPEPRLDWQRSM